MSANFDVETALKEVQDKTEQEVEIETAYKWASRSCACYQLYNDTQEIKWLLRAEDTAHEAKEHAALANDSGTTLEKVEDEIDKYKNVKEQSSQDKRKEAILKLFELKK